MEPQPSLAERGRIFARALASTHHPQRSNSKYSTRSNSDKSSVSRVKKTRS